MSKPKLLLADDSITIQKVVNLTFADHGMDVVTFADGDSAIENFEAVKPDIVLADVNMPGLNGYQLCELLRSDAASSKVPIVLLVGSFEPFDREEAERVGASAHLTKPFSSIAELVSTVEGLLAGPQAHGDNGPEAENLQAEEHADPAPPARPETSDIDHLYEQSFVETIEIPEEITDYEFEPVDLDDEMIQTSYVGDGPANAPVPEAVESFNVVEGEDAGVPEPPPGRQSDAESLIDDSVPRSEESLPQPEELEQADPAPVVRQASDPFASPAPELPPLSEVETRPWERRAKFSFDDSDLLELPSPGPNSPEAPAASPAPAPQPIVSLAPELIDLIVDKVVERLAQRIENGEIHSITQP